MDFFLSKKDEQAMRASAFKKAKEKLKKVRRMLTHLGQDLQVAKEVLHKAHEVELLKAALSSVRANADCVWVVDYFDPDMPRRPIVLDPKRTPQENLTKRFGELKKAKRAIPILENRMQLFEEEQKTLLKEMHAIETSDTWRPTAEEETKPLPKEVQKRSPKKEERMPFLVFESVDGRPILVGKSAKDNDLLTFRHAKGNDHWFHAKSTKGSHVVVPYRANQPISKETIQDAAILALYFSKNRGEKGAEVGMTQVKYLKRPKGNQTPGLVLVQRETTLWVALEPARLQRLLAAKSL